MTRITANTLYLDPTLYGVRLLPIVDTVGIVLIVAGVLCFLHNATGKQGKGDAWQTRIAFGAGLVFLIPGMVAWGINQSLSPLF